MRQFTLDDVWILGGVLLGFVFVSIMIMLVMARRDRVVSALRALSYGVTYVLFGAAEESPQYGTSRRSYDLERLRELPGTDPSELVPVVVSLLEPSDDTTLLEVLALLRNPDGSWRYAESRIGKFAPGRLEDRIDQVRAIRGTPPALQPPGRELVVRDKAGERRIPFDEVTA